ncbi:MAG TPA: hypothetical protein VKR58_07130 [Aquella sp.]|nr:hypothetical protein [Aquella sp.]
MLQPVKDIGEYKRLKETLKDRFENERTGDQDLFREQTKILQPLINTQQQTVKAIKDSQDASSTAITNALLPVVRELERREQSDMEQPFYREELPAIAQTSPDIVKIDLDANLDEKDRENLQDMSFELPSVVFKNKTVEETLENIKTENRSIGQKLGKESKLKPHISEVYSSRKQTLITYRQIIEGLQKTKQFVSTPKKRGKGFKNKIVDVIYYPSVEDLCANLTQLHAAKQAGNTGLDNNINSILDELLRVKAIDKTEYNTLYKNIFSLI